MPEVSIIIPVYNVEKYLLRCLESVKNQKFINIEVILVDDGSTDKSGNICDEFCKSNDRFSVIHKKNAGLGYARNTGLDYASGKYVLFIDSDDYIEANMIENMMQDIKEANADTCIGGFKRIYDKTTIVQQNRFAGCTFENEEIKNEVLVRMLGVDKIKNDFIEMSVWKVLFSLDIIRHNNIRFPSEREFISEDIIFDLEYYMYSNKLVMSHDTGYCYCDNDGSLTTKYRPERFDMQKKMYLTLCDLTKKKGIYDLAANRLRNTFVAVTRYCIKLESKFNNNCFCSKVQVICNDEVLLDTLKQLDASGIPLQSQIVNKLILRSHIYLLKYIMFFKNKFNI